MRMVSHRFIILGDCESGKSSLIKSLTSGVTQLCRKPTEGVEVTEWKPCEQYHASEVMRDLKIEEPETINIEMWDMTGRKCCWPLHQEYFSYSAVYLVTFNWLRQSSTEAVLSFLKLIQQKVPGSHVILICTHSSSVGYGRDRDETKLELMADINQWETTYSDIIIDQMNRIQEWRAVNYVMDEQHRLEDLLTKQLNVHPHIINIDMGHNKGLDQCIQTVLAVTLQRPSSRLFHRWEFPPLTPYDPNMLIAKLAELRHKHKIVIAKNYEGLDVPQDTLNLFSTAGLIHEFDTPKLINKTHLCIDLKQLAHASCLLHFDSIAKSFQFEAYRFWPKGSSPPRPEPAALVKALEKIPTCGVVCETLFPLLWQEKRYSEEQIKLMIHILSERSVIYNHTADDKSDDGGVVRSDGGSIYLPNYPKLSPDTKYFLPLIGSLSNTSPGVHWSEDLFDGDIQFGFVFQFLNNDISESLAKRLLVQCSDCCESANYKFLWNQGILCKYKDEVTSRFFYDRDKQRIYLCSRGQYDPASQSHLILLMWLTLKPMLHVVTSRLKQYQGIMYTIDIDVGGSPLITKLTQTLTQKSSTFRYPLWGCVHMFQNGQHKLEENGVLLDLDMIFDPVKYHLLEGKGSWVEAILPNMTLSDVITIETPTDDKLRNCQVRNKNSVLKQGTVNWRSEISEEIDMERRKYEESHRPHTVPDIAMRKQLRRIARSLVTSVITSAIVTVLVSENRISSQQEPLIEGIARAVTAGHKGDTTLAIQSINSAIRHIQEQSEVNEKSKASKVCLIL